MNAVANEALVRGTLLHDEPMGGHTSWRVGGSAETYFRPADLADLKSFLKALEPGVPVMFVGLGSNLLVRDGGLPGVVVNTLSLAADIEQLDDCRLQVGVGVPCTRLARACVRLRLGPAAFFAGIPGTLGGALTMNAGAFGAETWERVERVRTIDRSGAIHDRLPEEYRVGYRSVQLPGQEWFLEATLKFEAEPDASMADIQALVDRRKETQPIGQPSCGSVFRNPPGGFAAQLIESAGLKGETRGGAQVSTKHANFIINTGAATATEIEALIEYVRTKVRDVHGVKLELEVRIVGRPLENAD